MNIPWPWLESRAQRSPDAIALSMGTHSLTFSELDGRARRAASELANAGVKRETRVAALLQNSVPLVVALHAADRLSATWVSLNQRLTPSELAFQLSDAGATQLIFDDATESQTQQISVLLPQIRSIHVDSLLSGTSADTSRDTPNPGAPFVILYTSGTTGRPKGACLSRENLMASALASSAHLGSEAGDSWLACMPLFHIGGLSILFRSVIDGSHVVLQPRFDEAAVSAALDNLAIGFVSLTATMLRRVLDVRGSHTSPSSLRCVLLGGGPANSTLLESARQHGFPVRTTYGLTEAASQVATQRPSRPSEAGLTPLPGVEVEIRNDEGIECPGREIGEICVRGPNIMHGYVNAPDRTREALREGWLLTGDLGFLDDRGDLHVVDRRSDLIVSGGENIYPAEIENVLSSHSAIREVGVGGVDDAEFGRRPVAWWVAERGGESVTSEALAQHCRAQLAGYKVPVAFVRCDALPRDRNGKLLRRKLPRQLEPDAAEPSQPTPNR